MGAGWLLPLRCIADLILPRTCAVCDRALGSGEVHLCAPCADRFLREPPDYCPRCGHAAGPYLSPQQGCSECLKLKMPLDGFARAGTYAGPAGVLVRRFKFQRQQRLDGILGELLASALQRWNWARELDAFVPIPATWGSRFRYGGWPAGLVAAQLGRRLKTPVLPLLRIRRKKRRQTGLPLAERRVNVRRAFRPARGISVKDLKLCVVDDVSTSGATLAAAARVLKRAGAGAVFGAVVAKTEPTGWAHA